jgi:hypothetical protein
MKKVIFIGFLFCCAFSVKAQNNLILNGSFEDNIITSCYIDAFPNEFNDSVANITSFGGTVVVLNDSCITCGLLPNYFWGGGAQEGPWFASVHSDTFSFPTGNSWSRSIFSFHLSDTLSSLKNYKLSFYIKNPPYPSFPNNIPTCDSIFNNSIKIGISDSATNPGTIIYQSSLGGIDWTQHSFVFNTTNTGEYITLQSAIGDTNEHLVFIDNFVLVETTEPATVFVTVNTVPPTFNCVNNYCLDPLDGSGFYTSGSDCVASCGVNTTAEIHTNNKKYLLKIVDILGRESKPTATGLLFYIYSDGSVEKKIYLD